MFVIVLMRSIWIPERYETYLTSKSEGRDKARGTETETLMSNSVLDFFGAMRMSSPPPPHQMREKTVENLQIKMCLMGWIYSSLKTPTHARCKFSK